MKQTAFKTSLATYTPAVWNGVNTSGWEPLDNKVLVAPDQASTKSIGGVEIPEEFVERMTMAAEAGVVVALGSSCTANLKPGDRVYMERYAGQLVTGHDERVYRLMEETSIGAVFRKT